MAASSTPDDGETDTVAMADIIREDQGSFEMEVACGWEADLHKHYSKCKKNPGHDQFVAIDDFNREHLPPEYQDPDIVQSVKAHSDLTVRLYVKCISDKRPKFWTDGKKPYPFYKYRGNKSVGRTGTGFISYVFENPGQPNCQCKCYTCTTTGQRRKTWGEIDIQTATHVVFDDQEVSYTKCHLFYDTRDADLNDLPTLEGMVCIKANTKTDRTRMRFYTHDVDLMDRLSKMLTRYIELRRRVYNRYKNIPYCSLLPSLDDDLSHKDREHKLLVIVSHPHGCSKQVTVGKWSDRKDSGAKNSDTQYIYDTKTCPGTSGAVAYVLGSENPGYYSFEIIHRGTCDTTGLNCSGFGTDDIDVQMLIPCAKVGLVCDKMGKILFWYERVTGVIMDALPNAEDPSSSDKLLTITGHPDRCKRAKQFIGDLLSNELCHFVFEDSKGNYTVHNSSLEESGHDEHYCAMYIEVPLQDVSFFESKGRTVIKKIRLETQTWIQLTYDGGQSENGWCLVAGSKDDVHLAVDMVQKALCKAKTKGCESACVAQNPGGTSDELCKLRSLPEANPISQGQNHEDKSDGVHQLKIVKVMYYPPLSSEDSDSSEERGDNDDDTDDIDDSDDFYDSDDMYESGELDDSDEDDVAHNI